MGWVATLVVLALVAPAAAASADAITDKQAEAAAVATKLGDQARRIVTLDADYRRAQRQLSEAESAVAQAEAELAGTVRRQEELKGLLAVTARDAYVTGGNMTLLRYLVTADPSDQVARRAYLNIVTGQDRRLIGRLRATREDLAAQRQRLDEVRRRAGDQADAIGADRRALDQAMAVQKANLAAINGELVSLVAAEQNRLAAEAAAAAARTAAAAATPRPAAAPAVPAPAPAAMPNADAWACIRQLESGNNYASPGAGAYGIIPSTWASLGYSGTADDYPPAVQDEAALRLYNQYGWEPWTTSPACGLL